MAQGRTHASESWSHGSLSGPVAFVSAACSLVFVFAVFAVSGMATVPPGFERLERVVFKDHKGRAALGEIHFGFVLPVHADGISSAFECEEMQDETGFPFLHFLLTY